MQIEFLISFFSPQFEVYFFSFLLNYTNNYYFIVSNFITLLQQKQKQKISLKL